MTERRTTRSILPSTVLLAIQLLVLAVSAVQVWFRANEVPGCDRSCDYGVLNASNVFYPLLATAILVVAGVLVYRRPESWWIPLLGIALTLAACYGVNVVVDAALTPVPDRGP